MGGSIRIVEEEDKGGGDQEQAKGRKYLYSYNSVELQYLKFMLLL